MHCGYLVPRFFAYRAMIYHFCRFLLFFFPPRFSTFFLNSVLFLSPSRDGASAPSAWARLGAEIPPLAGRSSSSSASPLAVARQLRIIKWWIRGYFLPTQTGGGRAAVCGCRFYPAFYSKCYQIPLLPYLAECRKQSWKPRTSLCVSSPARINEPWMLQGKIPAVIWNSSPLLLIFFFLLFWVPFLTPHFLLMW